MVKKVSWHEDTLGQVKSQINDVVYRLTLPPELFRINDVFLVSMLKKYVTDPKNIIHHAPLEIRENATCLEKPARVVETKEQVLRNRAIHWV